ncbi:hypothetical protein EIP91_011462, partial [Steccherinum ochraceum]
MWDGFVAETAEVCGARILSDRQLSLGKWNGFSSAKIFRREPLLVMSIYFQWGLATTEISESMTKIKQPTSILKDHQAVRSAGDGVHNAHIRGPSLLGSDTHSSPRRKDKHTAVETIFSDTASDDENDGEEYEIVSRGGHGVQPKTIESSFKPSKTVHFTNKSETKAAEVVKSPQVDIPSSVESHEDSDEDHMEEENAPTVPRRRSHRARIPVDKDEQVRKITSNVPMKSSSVAKKKKVKKLGIPTQDTSVDATQTEDVVGDRRTQGTRNGNNVPTEDSTMHDVADISSDDEEYLVIPRRRMSTGGNVPKKRMRRLDAASTPAVKTEDVFDDDNKEGTFGSQLNDPVSMRGPTGKEGTSHRGRKDRKTVLKGTAGRIRDDSPSIERKVSRKSTPASKKVKHDVDDEYPDIFDFSDEEFQEALDSATKASLADSRSVKPATRADEGTSKDVPAMSPVDENSSDEEPYPSDATTEDRLNLADCQVTPFHECDPKLEGAYRNAPFLLDMGVEFPNPPSTVVVTEALKHMNFDVVREGRRLIYDIRSKEQFDDNLFNPCICNVDQFAAWNAPGGGNTWMVSKITNYSAHTHHQYAPVAFISFGFVKKSVLTTVYTFESKGKTLLSHMLDLLLDPVDVQRLPQTVAYVLRMRHLVQSTQEGCIRFSTQPSPERPAKQTVSPSKTGGLPVKAQPAATHTGKLQDRLRQGWRVWGDAEVPVYDGTAHFAKSQSLSNSSNFDLAEMHNLPKWGHREIPFNAYVAVMHTASCYLSGNNSHYISYNMLGV